MACLQTQGLAAIDSLDPVGLGSAVRKGGQNEYAGHETDRVGLKLKAIALGSMKRQRPGPVPDSVSHS